MEPAWRDSDVVVTGDRLVGVDGGDWVWLPARDFSSSDSLRPRTFRLDLCITAKRSSVVLGRVGVGVGVTMFLSDAPFADGAGDDSAVLDSKTSPRT